MQGGPRWIPETGALSDARAALALPPVDRTSPPHFRTSFWNQF
jgi:hypothetical protein